MPLYPFFPELCERPTLAACILSAMPLLQGKSFFEVGCGNGYFCGYALSRYAGPVVGMDRDEHLLARARRHFPGCQFQTFSRLPGDRFDVVLAREPLPADSAAVQSYLHKLVARLRPGGVLLLETPQISNKNDAPSYRDLTRSLPAYSWRASGSADGSSILCIRHREPIMELPLMPQFTMEDRVSA